MQNDDSGGAKAADTTPFFLLEQPLDLLPRDCQMRIAHLDAFPDLARGFGGDPRALLERHDIDPQQISDPDHLIECTAFTGLLEDCSTVFNDPLFGLKLAELHDPDVYGCVIALCRAAPTLRKALESLVKYLRVTHSGASMLELVEGEKVAELRWFVLSDLGHNQQANYNAALLMMKLLRQVGGRSFTPYYVNLSVDARRRDIAGLERAFGCRFHCTTADNAIAFPREYLDRGVPGASRLLFNLLSGYLDRVRASSEQSIEEKVANYIRSTLSSGSCSVERCAQKLGVAVRTLQARLRESGLEFSQIVEQQRLDLAKTYLNQEQLSLDEIAANLGYAEQSSFGRAFKRWTGMTPRQFRVRRAAGR